MRNTPATNCSAARLGQTEARRLWPSKVSRTLVVATVSLCIAAAGFAQSTNSSDLRGTVTDSTGRRDPRRKGNHY